MRVFSAWLALAFGTFLSVAEAVRNSGEVQWWPFWVVDYLAVALLMWGAVAILWRPSERGIGILTAGWGFTSAMFYMSLFSHISTLQTTGGEVAEINAQSALDEPWLTVVIGVLFAVTLIGLATSLVAEMRRAVVEA
ncbi:MAG: hypothetical protein KBA31_01175 [Alphaproteobacteria bacterium]|nr:hypothetical protein [Alphaproteobacteria bacterium]